MRVHVLTLTQGDLTTVEGAFSSPELAARCVARCYEPGLEEAEDLTEWFGEGPDVLLFQSGLLGEGVSWRITCVPLDDLSGLEVDADTDPSEWDMDDTTPHSRDTLVTGHDDPRESQPAPPRR